MRRVLAFSAVLCFGLFFAGTALAASSTGFVPLSPIPNLTTGATTDASGLATFLNNLYKYLVGIAGIIAVIEIIWGGILISTAADNASKVSGGRQKIYNALFGLVLVLSPAIVFSAINPAILNLSLNLPALNTAAYRTNTPVQSTALPGGVTQNISGTFLKTASFASNNPDSNNRAAQNWISSCDSALSAVNGITSASTCSGGYDGAGKCVGASSALAVCAYKNPTPFTFIDVETGSANKFLGNHLLKPIDTAAATFLSQCSVDGGKACVSAHSLTPLNACPPRDFAIPPNAPNAKAGGSCYQATLSCTPPLYTPLTQGTYQGQITTERALQVCDLSEPLTQ